MLIHLTLRYGLFIVLLLAQAAAWRFGSLWSGVGMSSLALIFTGFFAQKLPDCWRQQQALCLLSAAIVATLGSFEVLWPCELSCSKGEEFAQIFEIPVLWFAAGAYLIATLLHSSGRPSLGLAQQCCGWLLFGSSLFYLGLSAYLAMICPLCIAIHSCILCASICAWNGRRSMGPLLCCSLLGASLVAGLYGLAYYRAQHAGDTVITPQTDNDDPLNAFFATPNDQATSQIDEQIIHEINRGRTLGDPAAPYQLALFIRLGCNHCASWVPQIYEDSKQLCKAYPISIRFHYLINRMSAKSIQRHHLALSAALDQTFFLAQTALLGNEADAIGYSENLAAFGLNPTALEQTAQLHKASLERIIKDDKKLLNSSRFVARASPILCLIQEGQIIEQWDGKDNWGSIKAALQERTTSDGQK